MSSQKSRVLWMGIGLTVAVFACCALPVWGDDDSNGEVPPPPQDVFTWKALPYSADSTQVCWLEEGGEPGTLVVVCHDACPFEGICAEFSNRHGVVDLVCCIDPEVEGTSNVGDCSLEATLVRGGGPPEFWDIPWL